LRGVHDKAIHGNREDGLPRFAHNDGKTLIMSLRGVRSMTKQSRERTKMSAILLSLKKQTSDFKSKIKNIKYMKYFALLDCHDTFGISQ
jgi:tricorn protease-like protein